MIDLNNDPFKTGIMTEQFMTNAPLEIHLHFREDAHADNYKLDFIFTYFNGSEWTGSTNTIGFRINNLAQQYEEF